MHQSFHSSTSNNRPEISASIEVMVDHFVKTAPAKRKLSLSREGPSEKIKKTVETETNSGQKRERNEELYFPNSEISPHFRAKCL